MNFEFSYFTYFSKHLTYLNKDGVSCMFEMINGYHIFIVFYNLYEFELLYFIYTGSSS